MVLGSKFLDFIIKGAETLKQPHLNQIEYAIQQTRKQRLRTCIIIMTAMNVCCLFSSLPATLKKEHVTDILGDAVGQPIFVVTSHILTFVKVVGSYCDVIRQQEFVVKMSLFSRTIFMMLMYSMGLKVNHFSFPSLFVAAYPFALLALAFLYKVIDGFRLTRFTSLLVIWSIFAGGLLEQQQWSLSPQVLMVRTIMYISLTNKY